MALGKLAYVQGKARPNVECIFCAVRDNDERVVSLKIYEDSLCFIVLNLYPFNPAHLVIVTQRHITKFFDLNPAFNTFQKLSFFLSSNPSI